MTDKVLAFIREYRLIEKGDTVLCAVSGGADSTALLHLLFELREVIGFQLRAAHFNHMLRGSESDGDEQFVRELCEKLGIPLQTGRGDVRKEAEARKTGLEETARALRYAFLSDAAGKGAKIATAHTADDNAETLLMHLMRGSGLKGFCGIPPKRGSVIRPMLPLTHREAREYLLARGFTWREDSTNQEDDCLRNRIRHTVVPILSAENPRFSETILRNSLVLRDEDNYMDELAKELLQSAAGIFGYRCAVLREASKALLRRALMRCVGEYDYSHIAALEEALRAGKSGSYCFPGGHSAVLSCGWLAIDPPQAVEPAAYCCDWTEPPAAFDFGLFALELRQAAEMPENRFPGSFCLTLPAPETAVTLRTRLPGDSISLSSGSKSLKKAMIDKKIPVFIRDFLPVICYNSIPVFVPFIGTDPEYRAIAGQPVLMITLKNQKTDFK